MDINKFKDSFKTKKYAFHFVFDLIDTLNSDVTRIEYVGSTDDHIQKVLESCLIDAHRQCEHVNVEIVSFNFTLTNNFEDEKKNA